MANPNPWTDPEAPSGLHGAEASFERFLVELAASLHSPDRQERVAVLSQVQLRLNRLLGVTRSTMFRMDPARKTMSIEHTAGETKAPLPSQGVEIQHLVPYLARRLFEGQKQVWVRIPEDVPAEASTDRKFVLDQGFRAMITVPLYVGGQVRWALGVGCLTQDPTWELPPVERITIVGQLLADALETHRWQTALSTREARYRTLFESAGIGILINRPDATCLAANESAARMFGAKVEDLIGRSPWEFAVDGETTRRLARRNIERALAGETVEFEWRGRRRDGSPFVAEIVLTSAHLDEGTAVQTVLRDVTGRRSAEARARRLASAMEQSQEATIVADPGGVIESCNKAARRTAGLRPVEGENLFEYLLRGQGRSVERDLYAAVQAERRWTRRISRQVDGKRIHEDVILFPIREGGDNGPITGWVSSVRDVTNQVALHERLNQTQKMEAIGTLAGGIAHDFNNLLGIMIGHAQVALEHVPTTSPAAYDLKQILTATRRATKLVRQILTVSRRSQIQEVPTDLRWVVKEALGFIGKAAPAQVRIESDLGSRSLVVRGDSTELHQVVMNLCTNAYQAMRARGGRLQVDLDVAEADEVRQHHPELSAQMRYARLTVSDEGEGMNDETRRRCFEPFYSTKPSGEGTGLGLSVVHGIIESHHGAIRVETRLEEGTTFEVVLPLHDDEADEGSSDEHLSMGLGSVLVVDDEPVLAQVAVRMLQVAGYQASAVSSAVQALDRVRDEPDEFDLVLVDINMPELNGLDLREAILQINPKLPVALTTGYHEWLGTSALPDGVVLIEKPFTVESLSEGLRMASGETD